jgi:hypothetical protein
MIDKSNTCILSKMYRPAKWNRPLQNPSPVKKLLINNCIIYPGHERFLYNSNIPRQPSLRATSCMAGSPLPPLPPPSISHISPHSKMERGRG